ncbi:MAG: recombination regulator RecX [Alcaligenaceae bacterium]|nr:recombination regulator RecX [Alcaligenaceae bacterium]
MVADPDDEFEQLALPEAKPVRAKGGNLNGRGGADADVSVWQRSSTRRRSFSSGREGAGSADIGTGRAKSGPSLKARAIGYLSRREHSRAELQRKLQPYANPDDPDEIPRLLNELEQGKWLSDQRFAQSLVNRRAPAKGSTVIMHELRQHGLTDTALESIRQQLQGTEYERAQAVWARKFGTAPADAREYARQVRFLASRGFSPAILRRILGELDDFSV